MTMPLATYSVDSGPDGGSVLYDFVRLVRRTRGAERPASEERARERSRTAIIGWCGRGRERCAALLMVQSSRDHHCRPDPATGAASQGELVI